MSNVTRIIARGQWRRTRIEKRETRADTTTWRKLVHAIESWASWRRRVRTDRGLRRVLGLL